MEYRKFNWTNDTVLDAKNFNNIEEGIANCCDNINEILKKLDNSDYLNCKTVENLKDEVANLQVLLKELDSLKEKIDDLGSLIKSIKTKVNKISKQITLEQ